MKHIKKLGAKLVSSAKKLAKKLAKKIASHENAEKAAGLYKRAKKTIKQKK